MNTTYVARSRSASCCPSCGTAGACHCGASACSDDVDDAGCHASGLVRPVFFAGQLLTEEDLQALTGYVVAKNRLHNRHQVGAGVVCGLDVAIDPCHGRFIRVAPGYALDCCGNDITVPCPVEQLDVIQMIQDLRAKIRGGYDCGDPCQQHQQENDKAKAAADPQQPAAAAAPPPLQEYDLYIRYCERKSDLVMPYEVESCGASNCKPSRIQEGFTFELRCAPPEKSKPQGKPSQLDHAPQASLKDRVTERFQNDPSSNLADALIPALSTLEALHKSFVQADKIKRTADAFTGQFKTDALAELRKMSAPFPPNLSAAEKIQICHKLVTWAFRTKLVSDQSWDTDLQHIKAAMGRAGQHLIDMANDGEASEDVKQLKTLLDQHANMPADSLEMQGALAGEMLTRKDVDEKLTNLNALRLKVLQLGKDGFLHVDAKAQQSLRAPIEVLPPTASLHDIRARREAALKLALVVLINRLRPLCESFLPPCPSCDDPVVRLARLTVDLGQCSVTDVCSLKRDYALTGMSLRYWFGGILERFLAAFTQMCCNPYQGLVKLRDELDHGTIANNWRDAAFQVSEMRRAPVLNPGDPFEMLAGLTKQMTILAPGDFEAVAVAIDPFGARADTKPAFDAIRKSEERLESQISDLKSTKVEQSELESVKAKLAEAQKEIDKLKAQPPKPEASLAHEWAARSLEPLPDQKKFLVAEFKTRLTPDGITKLISGSAQQKSISELLGKHFVQFDKAKAAGPNSVYDHWGDTKVRTTQKDGLLDREEKELNIPGAAPNHADVKTFWRHVHEIEFLLDKWPGEKLVAADIP